MAPDGHIVDPQPGPGVPSGVPGPIDPGTGGGCDCAHYAYEKGHQCYAQCGGTEGGGGSSSDHDWYLKEIKANPDKFDTNISEAQWIAWRNFWDDASKSFRTENVDSAGKAIEGTGFGKPVDCPEGTTKFWQNQCLPLSDWRVSGGGGGGTGGGATSKSKTTSAVPAVPDYSQVPYTSNDLANTLGQWFNYRAGIFGTKAPGMWGATSRAPAGQDIAGVFTPEGGLWWGGSSDLASALSSFGKQFTTTGSSTPATASSFKPQPQTQCQSGYHWDVAQGRCVGEASNNLPEQPVQAKSASFYGPLASALVQQPMFRNYSLQ